MNPAFVFVSLLGLIGCAVAQNNGIYSTGFAIGDQRNSPATTRLASARLLQSFTTTPEPLTFAQEDQYYEEKPSLHNGASFSFQSPSNADVYQESPRRQHANQFQFQDTSFQQNQEPNVFESFGQQKPAVRIGAPAVQHISQEAHLQNEKERLQQNKNAKYAFNSAISDTIFDNSHVREEVRDGLKLAGLYSYSDGFYKRTVHYVADEGGYRVVKEDVEPIGAGEGPLLNPNGAIDVAANYDGAGHSYHATAKDIHSLFKQQPEPSPSPSLSGLLTPPGLKLRQ